MKKLMMSVAAVAAVSVVEAKPAFCLPERIYAAPGLELNVYFKEVFDSTVPQNYAYQASCEKGKAELTRWCFTPKAEDAGKDYKLVINAWNDDGLVAAVTSKVLVAAAPKDPNRRVTLALLGDSLTGCRYQDQVLTNMHKAGYAGYAPVGSRAFSKDGAKHDGYGGYTFDMFLTHYNMSQDEAAHIQDQAEREQLAAMGVKIKKIQEWQRDLLRSPLVKLEDGKKKVDIPRWLAKINDGKAPDIVLIELGVNNIFWAKGEIPKLREQFRKYLVPQAGKLISRLRKDMPDATYLLCTLPVGSSQDGFGANYGSDWNEVQYRKSIFALNREYEAWIKEKNDPKILLVPVGHAVDPEDGVCVKKQKASARSKTEVVRSSNAVHPSAVGGSQMGDAISAMLMNILSR